MSVNNAFGCVAGYVLYDCGKVTGSDEQFGCIKRYFTLGGTMFMNQLDETFEYLFLTIYSFGLFLQEQVLGLVIEVQNTLRAPTSSRCFTKASNRADS